MNKMSKHEENPLSFIIDRRHAGLTLLTSIKGYSSILQKDILGDISNETRKALRIIYDCCEIPWMSWVDLSDLIEQNKSEKALEILGQLDNTEKSFLVRSFISKSLASLEIAEKQASAILKESHNLSDEQLKYAEIIEHNCTREIDIWKEIALHFS